MISDPNCRGFFDGGDRGLRDPMSVVGSISASARLASFAEVSTTGWGSAAVVEAAGGGS